MISAVHSNASVTVFSGRFHKIFICRIGSTRNLSCKIGLDAVRHRVTYRNTVFFKRYREYGSRLIRKNVCEIECIALYAADRERCKFRRCYFIYFSVKRYFRNYSVKIFRFNCYKYFDYFFVIRNQSTSAQPPSFVLIAGRVQNIPTLAPIHCPSLAWKGTPNDSYFFPSRL